MRRFFANFPAFETGAILLLFPALSFVSATILLFAGIQNLGLAPLSAFFASIPVLFSFRREVRLKAGATFLLLLAGGCLFSEFFIDTSFDGVTYHQSIIYLIKSGWNPIREPYPSGRLICYWCDVVGKHYALGVELNAASFYSLTGSLEMSKALNWSFALGSFFLCYDFLSTPAWRTRLETLGPRMGLLVRLSFSFLLAFNPVTLLQLGTTYVDGQAASCLLSLGILLYSFQSQTEHRRTRIILAFCLLPLAVNIKFPVLLYSIVFFGAISFLVLLRNFKKGILLGLLSLSIIFISAAGFGFHPYVTNFRSFGTPIYPVIPYRWDGITPPGQLLMSRQLPVNFEGKSRFEKLFRSVFGKAQSDALKTPSELKVPFSVSPDEFLPFQIPDARISGLGVFFSGLLLLSIFLLFLSAMARRSVDPGFLFVAAILVLSILLNPESWWARIAPQTFFLPFVFILASRSLFEREDRAFRLARAFLLFFIVAGFLNLSVMITASLSNQAVRSREIARTLSSLRENRRPILVDFHRFYANRARLEREGIQFFETNDLKCANILTLPSTGSEYCEKIAPHRE